jgi:putative ABC transport system permease protein
LAHQHNARQARGLTHLVPCSRLSKAKGEHSSGCTAFVVHNSKVRLVFAALTFIFLFAAPNASAQSEPLPTILLSRQLATAEGLHVGDTVALAAKPDGSSTRRFRVAGIYEPVADPMRLASERFEARLHLPDLLSLAADTSDPLASESVTAINVALKDTGTADSFAHDVSATIPIPQLTARAAQGGEGTATVFVVLDRFHFAIALVTVIASTVFLLALMVMLVEERRETVGILRLIGLRKGRILLQVLAEGLLIAVVGAAFGILFAAALEGAVNAFFQWRYDTSLIFVRITAPIAVRCVLLAVPLGVLASLISSWTLLRSNILDLARR